MKNWLAKSWFPLTLVVGILILLFLLFKKNGAINTHKGEKQVLMNERDSIKSREQLANRAITSLSDKVVQDTRLKDSLITELTAVKKQLGQSIGKNISLADQVRAAKLLRDTVRYVLACDSLANENAGLIFLVGEYSGYVDSLINVMTANDLRKDSILMLRVGLYNDLKKSYQLADSSYNNLFNSYTKQSKQLKRERVKTKLAAALGVALTLLTLIK